MSRTVDILDYGMGNLRSVERMFARAGGLPRFISRAEEVERSEKLVIPGVGHFDEGVRALRRLGIHDSLCDRIKSGQVPVLGICLGMQLLCKTSDEGTLPGLGLVNAQVKLFAFPHETRLKVPHMGWNNVVTVRDNPLIPASDQEQRFYFVHSYFVSPCETDLGIADAVYGHRFCAAFAKGKIFGVQFHPEKSHRFGLNLFRRFLEL